VALNWNEKHASGISMSERVESNRVFLVVMLACVHAVCAAAATRPPRLVPFAAQQAAAPAAAANSESVGENPTVILETSKGTVKIELFPAEAPTTVENFLRYVDAGFYDETVFHRVIRSFVVQGGGFTPELELKPTLAPVPIESRNGLENKRGSVAMARNLDRDSATSQFYINLSDNEQLDRGARNFGYTVFGRVIEGMDVIDRISAVQTSRRGQIDDIPILPVFLETARRAKP
jgi:peptidyl-prolyl cis-trans isomerase A (cyclophilin A)